MPLFDQAASRSYSCVRPPRTGRLTMRLDGVGLALDCSSPDLELQRVMRTGLVVVLDELAQHVPKVLLVDQDDVVQALPARCPHQRFGDRVRPALAPPPTLATAWLTMTRRGADGIGRHPGRSQRSPRKECTPEGGSGRAVVTRGACGAFGR